MTKVLLFAAGGLLLLALAIVVAGSLLPARHVVSRSASFPVSRERLYALITGPQDWRSDIVRAETVAGPGMLRTVRETDRSGQTIAYEVTTVASGESLQRRIANDDLPYRGSWSFELKPAGDATTLTITEDGTVANPVFRFVARFLIGHARTIEGYLRDLGRATGRSG